MGSGELYTDSATGEGYAVGSGELGIGLAAGVPVPAPFIPNPRSLTHVVLQPRRRHLDTRGTSMATHPFRAEIVRLASRPGPRIDLEKHADLLQDDATLAQIEAEARHDFWFVRERHRLHGIPAHPNVIALDDDALMEHVVVIRINLIAHVLRSEAERDLDNLIHNVEDGRRRLPGSHLTVPYSTPPRGAPCLRSPCPTPCRANATATFILVPSCEPPPQLPAHRASS